MTVKFYIYQITGYFNFWGKKINLRQKNLPRLIRKFYPKNFTRKILPKFFHPEFGKISTVKIFIRKAIKIEILQKINILTTFLKNSKWQVFSLKI